MNKTKIFITGIGCFTSVGHDIPSFLQSLQQGKCGISFLKGRSTGGVVNIGAELPLFNFTEELEKRIPLDNSLRQKVFSTAFRSPLPMQGAVLAALEAWQKAGLDENPCNSERMALIVSGGNLTRGYQHAISQKYLKNPMYLPPSYALHFHDSDYLGTLSEIFSIHGDGFCVGTASASGNTAIIRGFQLLQFGYIDVCLIIGAMADLSPVELQGCFNIGAYGGKVFKDFPEKSCRPSDREHEGFIYGQGIGCIVLETETSVKKRTSASYAELLGGAIYLDGNRLANPDPEGEVQVMKKCIASAGLHPEDITYINAHGSSSPLGDETEAQAICSVFHDESARPTVNSTKSITGHCLSSAAVIEAIATVLQMQHGFIHPNLNLQNPITEQHAPLHLAGPILENKEIRYALSNSFKFGGINTSILLKKE